VPSFAFIDATATKCGLSLDEVMGRKPLPRKVHNPLLPGAPAPR
jgi:hypothetical protein